ncbi:hypothetical protein P7K49_027513 [Saguinus oedipus]|uniref:Putative adherens-junction anchoring domain-containing protein n=1 Tax=Saguinus oedipus TaxID=9490 RepID=A0ABQ9UAI3_SAGOE|nr:hypothetical protein P7K49_027513 [Saguinus oedipus]
MDNQVLGYKDLAAIPKDKAILDIERPDLMIYEPHFTYSLLEHVELPRSREVCLSKNKRGDCAQEPTSQSVQRSREQANGLPSYKTEVTFLPVHTQGSQGAGESARQVLMN